MSKKIRYPIYIAIALFIIVLICIFAFSSCSSSSLVVKASKNTSDYNLTLVYNDDTKSLYGSQKVNYLNTTGDNLNEIFFHLHANAFRENAKFKPVSDLLKNNAYPNGESYGHIDIKNVKVNNKDVEFSVGGDDKNILIVPLSNTLYTNSRVDINLEYDIILPNIKHRFGYADDIINLGNFYPIACVYENGKFDTSPYSFNGDPFYSDIANYNVSLTCNKDFIVAGSGDLKECKSSDKQNIYKFKALAIRDFALSMSKKFKTTNTKIDGISINYYYDNDEKEKESLKTAINAVKYFNNSFGKYPYKTLNIVETGFVHGGMEFSNIVFISNDLASYEEYTNVIVHEIAHQWWYGVVGDNQNKDGFIDEGLAEYSCILFYENYPEYEKSRKEILSEDLKSYLLFVDVYGDLFENFDTSMDRNLVDYTTEPEYTYMAYVKSVLMFDNLRQLIGDKDFLAGLKYFYKANQLQFVKAKDLVLAFEKYTNIPLQSFFDSWIDGKIIITSD